MQAAVDLFLTQASGPEARISAHTQLNQQLKEPDCAEAVECLTRNLQALLSELERDLVAPRVEVVGAALRTVSYFLHHPVFSSRIPQQLGVCISRRIVELLEMAADKEVCTLALWCLHIQRTPRLLSGLASRALAAAESALANKWQSMLVGKQALDAATTLVNQFPQLGQQFVDSTSQTKVAWMMFATAVKEATVDTLQAIVQLFEQLNAAQPRVDLSKIWVTAEADLTVLMENLIKLMDGKEKLVAVQAWKALMYIIPPSDVAQPAVLNPLLKIPKQCFVSNRTSLRHEGYRCWKLLIEVLGEISAWEEAPNMFPLLLLPIERAFQPEKGSSNVCRVAAIDALTMICMRSGVSTSHLLQHGLASLLLKCLAIDEAIDDSWEGCTGILRTIACCCTPLAALRNSNTGYWQDIFLRPATDDGLFLGSTESLDELDTEKSRHAIDMAGGLPQYLKMHSTLLTEALRVIDSKLAQPGRSPPAHILQLVQHVFRQRVRFSWAYLVSSPNPGTAEQEMQPQPTGSQLTQYIGGSQSEIPFSNPPANSMEVIRLLMSELKIAMPNPSRKSIRSSIYIMLLETLLWISSKCNAFALGVGNASDDWQEWTVAMQRTVTSHDPPSSLTLSPSTVNPPEVPILEVQMIALLALTGALDESSLLPFDHEYLRLLSHDCAAVVLKTGALPNLLRVFHRVIPMPANEGMTIRQMTGVLQRSMFLVEALWMDVMAMLSSMAATDLGDIDNGTRQATVAGLQEVCWLPFRVYCQTTSHCLHHFFPETSNIQAWLQVVAVLLKEQTSHQLAQFLPGLHPVDRNRGTFNGSPISDESALRDAAVIMGLVRHGLQMLNEHPEIEEESCAAFVALLLRLCTDVPATSPSEHAAHIAKAVCKLLLKYQRGQRRALHLLPLVQEWLARCIEDFSAALDAESDETRRSACRPLAVGVLTTLSSVAVAASLQTCTSIKSSLTTLLQSLLTSNGPAHDALGATARQFFMDVYNEQLLSEVATPEHQHEGAKQQHQQQGEEELTPRHCGKRTTDTSPAKDLISCSSLPTLASTKSPHSYTQLLQSKMRTQSSNCTEAQQQSINASTEFSTGTYLRLHHSDGLQDPDMKRRKTVPVTTYTSLDGSQPAGDDALQIPVELFPNSHSKEANTRASLLCSMDAVARELDTWDGTNTPCLDEALTLWSDILQKLWQAKGSQL